MRKDLVFDWLKAIAIGAAFGAMLAWAYTAQAEPTTYYDSSYCGSMQASGIPLDCSAFTAAHPSLPFGTIRTVCYNGCVDVVITDRGPTLDLSPAAAGAIGMIDAGRIDA